MRAENNFCSGRSETSNIKPVDPLHALAWFGPHGNKGRTQRLVPPDDGFEGLPQSFRIQRSTSAKRVSHVVCQSGTRVLQAIHKRRWPEVSG